jgi:hypothetical protein
MDEASEEKEESDEDSDEFDFDMDDEDIEDEEIDSHAACCHGLFGYAPPPKLFGSTAALFPTRGPRIFLPSTNYDLCGVKKN